MSRMRRPARRSYRSHSYPGWRSLCLPRAWSFLVACLTCSSAGCWQPSRRRVGEVAMQNPRPLLRSFYMPSADLVAPKLLGHFLLRRIKSEWVGGPIVETEAYLFEDPASHSYVGET